MQNQGDYAIADCLKANTRRLSSACRRVIEAGSRQALNRLSIDSIRCETRVRSIVDDNHRRRGRQKPMAALVNEGLAIADHAKADGKLPLTLKPRFARDALTRPLHAKDSPTPRRYPVACRHRGNLNAAAIEDPIDEQGVGHQSQSVSAPRQKPVGSDRAEREQ
jgi:hypothetical protein